MSDRDGFELKEAFRAPVHRPDRDRFLPSSFQETIGKYLPGQAGMAIFNVIPDPRALTPWTGLAVLLAYGALTLAAGGAVLVRRDA